MRKARVLTHSSRSARLANLSMYLSLGTAALVLILAAAGGLKLGIRVVPSMAATTLFAMLAFAHRRHDRENGDTRLAIGAGAVLILFAGGLSGGLICLVGQTFAMPLIDPLLHRADMMLGANIPWIIEQLVRIPALPVVLAIAYVSSFPLIFLSVLAFAWTGRSERAWELCGVFNMTLLAVAICSLLIPAAGTFYYLQIPVEIRQALPPGSGTYYLHDLFALRHARSYVIDPTHLQGVATFPSFHTALALMTAAAWRNVWGLRTVMATWQALVILSAIPIGGHYGADLMGGAICWGLAHVIWQKAAARGRGATSCRDMFWRSPELSQHPAASI